MTRDYSEAPTILATALLHLDQHMTQSGINLADELSAVGIDPGTVEDFEVYVLLDRFAILLQHLSEKTRNPLLGFHHGRTYQPGSSGAFGYVIINSPSVRDAIENICRYLHLFISVRSVTFEVSENIATLNLRFPVAFSPRSQVVDMVMAILVQRLRLALGPDWVPLAVALEHRPMGGGMDYQRLFGSRISFNAEHNQITMNATALSRAMPSPDTTLYSVVSRFCERLDQENASEALGVRRVRFAIADGLSNAETTLEQVSRRLGVAPRELTTILETNGTTFQRVFENTRYAMAQYYLVDTDIQLTEVALLLGFSELSAFTRAARRWFDMAPRDYRRSKQTHA